MCKQGDAFKQQFVKVRSDERNSNVDMMTPPVPRRVSEVQKSRRMAAFRASQVVFHWTNWAGSLRRLGRYQCPPEAVRCGQLGARGKPGKVPESSCLHTRGGTVGLGFFYYCFRASFPCQSLKGTQRRVTDIISVHRKRGAMGVTGPQQPRVPLVKNNVFGNFLRLFLNSECVDLVGEPLGEGKNDSKYHF